MRTSLAAIAYLFISTAWLVAGEDAAEILIGFKVVSVEGDLSKEMVKRVADDHLLQVRTCYQRALNRKPELAGNITLFLLVSPAGWVVDLSLVRSTLGDKPFEDSLSYELRNWRFYNGNRGVNKITVSWDFKTKN